MTNIYLHQLEKLLKRVHSRSLITHQLIFKNCFGAVAGYVDDHIFISCGKFGIALRLDPETVTEFLKEAGFTRLRYFPKGHVKKEYVIIPKRIINNQDLFKELLDKSLHYVSSLPLA